MAELASPIFGALQSAKTSASSPLFAAALKSSEETNNLLRTNNSTLLSLTASLGNIRDKVGGLSSSLQTISQQITSESFLEKQKVLQEQQQERILAQQALREGKESQIEKKIQSALINPVQRIGNTAKNILSGLMTAFTTILGGWLLEQGIQALKAYAEGDKEKLIEIRNTVLKNLGIIGGVFLGVRFGLGALLRGVGTLTAKILTAIGNNLFKKPFQAILTAAAGALGLGGANKPPTPGPGGGKPGGGLRGPGLLGGLFASVEAFMNFRNGENVDAIMNAALLLPTPPIVRGLLLAGVTADLIAETFGSNIFGKNPNHERKAKEIAAEAEKQKKENQQQAQTQPPAKPPPPAAQAQTPMMGGNAKPSGEQGVEANVSGTLPLQTADSVQAPPSGGDMNVQITSPATVSGTSSASSGGFSFPDYSGVFSGATTNTSQSVTPQQSMIPTQSRIQISTDYSQMSMEQLKKMLDPTKTGASNPAVFAAASAARAQGQSQGLTGEALERQVLIATIEASKGSPSGTSSTTQAQITATPSVNLQNTVQSVGPIPEPPTSVVVAPQQAAPTQPIKTSSGIANDVPAIPTSNIDNFYLLYSQVQYNIVTMA